MSRHALMLLSVGLVSTGCRSESPESVVRDLLGASAEGNLGEVRDLLVPECDGSPLARGSATQVAQGNLRPGRIEVTLATQDEGRASVAYSIEGEAAAGDAFEVGGTHADSREREVRTVRKTGTIWLTQIDGRWLVDCPR